MNIILLLSLVSCFCTLSNAQGSTTTLLLGTSHAFDSFWVSPTVVFLLTNNASGIHQLYRSSDVGKTWNMLSGTPTMSDPTGGCYVMYIFQDPNDAQKLIFLGPSSMQCGWNSLDGGVTFQYLTIPAVEYIYFHPNNTGWAIAIDYYGSASYWTEDLGQNWHQFYNTTMAAWLLPSDYSSMPLTGAYLLQGGFFGYSSDLGDTFTPISPDLGASYLYSSSNFVYVKMQDQTLLVGQNKGNFQTAYFPFGNNVGIFTVTDDALGATWFEHDESLYWGGLYSTGTSGALYVPSLSHVLKRADGFLDFFEVKGLPGVHIANTVVNYNDFRDLQLKTMITFNNGNTWTSLIGPIGGVGSLNLYFSHTTFGARSFYSSPNLVGILVANGNFGMSLSFDNPVNLGTFISYSGGFSWQPLFLPFPGPSNFEFGDHGSIFVVTPLWQSTSILYYSLDQGSTFFPYNFSTSNIWITKIRTAEDATSKVFFLYGTTDDANGYSAVYSVDFSFLQLPSCQQSDYTQLDFQGYCNMGQTVTYTRRRQMANCTDENPTDPIFSTVICECSYSDYECDFGYAKVAGQTSCAISYRDILPSSADCVGTYESTQGYRLIPGDVCQGGLNIGPVIMACPSNTSVSYGSVAAIVVVLVLLFIVAGVSVVTLQDPRLKQKFRDFIGFTTLLEKWESFSFTSHDSYRRVRVRSGSLANEDDFSAHDDLLGNTEDDDAKILHDHDILKAEIAGSPPPRSSFNPRNLAEL